MDSPNPRLAGLWVAKFSGLKQSPTDCYGCGQRIPPHRKCFRLLEEVTRYGQQPKVVGYLCRACRKALGPVHSACNFKKIEGT